MSQDHFSQTSSSSSVSSTPTKSNITNSPLQSQLETKKTSKKEEKTSEQLSPAAAFTINIPFSELEEAAEILEDKEAICGVLTNVQKKISTIKQLFPTRDKSISYPEIRIQLESIDLLLEKIPPTPGLRHSIRNSIKNGIAPLQRDLELFFSQKGDISEAQLSVKTQELCAQQERVTRDEHLHKALKATLGAIKQALPEERAGQRCFISYPRPTTGYQEKESWIQPFLRLLHQHLKEAGLTPLLDIIDTPPGGSLVTFTNQIRSSEFAVLICTESLLNHHNDPQSKTIKAELSLLQQKYDIDIAMGQARVFPLLLSGSRASALLPEHDLYRKVHDWRTAHYLKNLEQLIGWICYPQGVPEAYQKIWQTFYASITDIGATTVFESIARENTSTQASPKNAGKISASSSVSTQPTHSSIQTTGGRMLDMKHSKQEQSTALDFPLKKAISDLPLTLALGKHLKAEEQPISYAITCESKSVQEIKELITKGRNSHVKEKDADGFNPLHYAIMAGRTDLLKDTNLQSKFNWSATSTCGIAPIHLAIASDRYDALAICLKHQAARVSTKRELQILPPKVGEKAGTVKEIEFSPFHLAIVLGKDQALDVFLKRREESWDVPGLGNVFHLAVLANQPVALRQLLSREDRYTLLDAAGPQGMHVLSYAAASNRPFIIDELLSYYKRHPTLAQRLGQLTQALAYGVAYGSSEAVQCLLEYTEVHAKSHLEPVALSGEKGKTSALARAETLAEKFPDDNNAEAIRLNLVNYGDDQIETQYRHPNLKEQRIDNLVFQGGGIKGVAYVGALEVLSQQLMARQKEHTDEMGVAPGEKNIGDFPGIHRVAGTSAGAITSLLIALGFSVKDIGEALKNAPFDQFLDGLNIEKFKKASLFSQLQMVDAQLHPDRSMWSTVLGPLTWYQTFLGAEGLCQGNRILGWLSELLHAHLQAIFKENAQLKQGLPELMQKIDGVPTLTLTFGDLKQLISRDSRFKHLHVIAVKLPEKSQQDVGDAKHAQPSEPAIETIDTEAAKWSDVLVVDAIRASMSIPGVFTPWQLRSRTQNGLIATPTESAPRYVDGGILKNYPIERFDRFGYTLQSAYQGGDQDAVLPNRYTLGFRLYTPAESKENTTPVQESKHTQETPIGRMARLRASVANVIKALQSAAHTVKDAITPDPLHKPLSQLVQELSLCFWSAEDMVAEFQGTRIGRTIEISNARVGTLDFNLSPAQQAALLDAGRSAVKAFFTDSDVPLAEVSSERLLAPADRKHEMPEHTTSQPKPSQSQSAMFSSSSQSSTSIPAQSLSSSMSSSVGVKPPTESTGSSSLSQNPLNS